jgi:hypothetical protein
LLEGGALVSTLHDQLEAAIKERLAVAQAATPGPWRYNPSKAWHSPEDLPTRRNGEEFVGAGPLDATVGVAATGPADEPQSMADATFIAANGPDRIIRDCTEDLWLLRKHPPCTDEDCAGGDCHSCTQFMPCSHVVSLMRRYGVEVPE